MNLDRFDPQAPAVLTRPADVPQPRWSPARLAYGFYAVAASGAVVGQTWVAVTHVPWELGVPGLVRVLAVLPFAVCLELLAMALAAMADQRLRLGERAYGFRIFSAVVATVAVGILVAGHWPHLYWSAAFGVLSGSAYLLWLLHSAARRRDALRVADKLADTAPDYGVWRRLRHPIWTARAAELAREGRVDADTGAWRPLGLYESLRASHLAIRAEQRRPAVARAVEQVVRADQRDPRMAEIAVRTLDLDRLATELESRVDYGAWADRLAPAITAPLPATANGDGDSLPGQRPDHGTTPQADAAREDSGTEAAESLVEYVGSNGHSPATPSLTPPLSPPVAPARPPAEPAEPEHDDDQDESHEPDRDPDLATLLPAARAARERLTRQGRSLTRDSLAAQLRRDGHTIRTSRVSALLNLLRNDEPATVNGRRASPK